MKSNGKRPQEKPKQMIVKFYDRQKDSYNQFIEYIGARSDQGMVRQLIAYAIARPALMQEVIAQYDAQAVGRKQVA